MSGAKNIDPVKKNSLELKVAIKSFNVKVCK